MAESGLTSTARRALAGFASGRAGLSLRGRSASSVAGGLVAGVVLLAVTTTVQAGTPSRVVRAAVFAVSISGQVSPSTVALGTGFADLATLTVPPGGPSPSGTISFAIYGPTDPNCAGPVLFNSTNTLGGATTRSSSFTPPNAGTYRVVARYSGDSNYQAVATACGDPAETVLVGPRPTLTAISPTAGSSVGQNTVTITGTDLTGATSVAFGGVATPAGVLGPTQVVATAPAGSGQVDVTVTTPFGTTPVVPADVYTYVAVPVVPPPTLVTSSVPQQPPVVVTGSATKITPTTAEFTGTVDPVGLTGTAQFEYTVRLAGGASETGRTPGRPVGPLRGTVTAAVTGLRPASRYRVRLLATTAGGATVGGATGFLTAGSPSSGPPVLARTFKASRISGRILVRLPGHGQPVTKLAAAVHLPVGTTLDTRHGAVRLTTATTTAGTTRSGSFSGATFTVRQTKAAGGLAVLRLVRASTSRTICAAGPGHALPPTDLGVLRANTTGRFEISGRYGATIGRLATWTTADRCDGLSASVSRGHVDIDDFAHGEAAAVHAGQTHFVKAP